MDRKKEILKASETVFLKYGYRKATLEDIANYCGLKKTGIYYYFKSRDDLFKTMFRNKLETITRSIIEQVEKADGFHEKIRVYMKTKYNNTVENKPFIEILNREDFPKQTVRFLLEEKHKIFNADFQILADIIEIGINSGTLAVKRKNSLIMMILGVIYGTITGNILELKNFDIDEHIEDTLHIILMGIKKRS